MRKYFAFIIGLFVMAGLAIMGGPADAGEFAGELILDGIGGIGGGIGYMALIVNKGTLGSIFTSLKTIYNKAFDSAPSDWQLTATLVPSTTKTNDYAWFGRFPKMRKWIGDKVTKHLKAHKYSITNDDFEATVEVERNDIEDDEIGIYNPMAQDAGFSAKQLPDEIVTELKDNAFVWKCYDGQNFYDTDHPVGKEDEQVSVSNKLTVALSAASVAAADASFGLAETMMMEFTDDEGRPLNLVPDILEVPPALKKVGRMLLEKEKLDDDSPNPYYGTAKLLINPRLKSKTQWMLHCTVRPLKPYIYQERKKPVFVSQTDLAADDVFSRKKYKFGAEARAAGGYAFWQMSVGSTGA